MELMGWSHFIIKYRTLIDIWIFLIDDTAILQAFLDFYN